MTWCWSKAWLGVAAWMVCSLAVASWGAPTDVLEWNQKTGSVRADLRGADVVTVLERIAGATGWKIYLEPGTKRTVSAKFKDRAPDKALDLLLGNLDRILLPGTNGGPARLLVFRNSQQDATLLIQAKNEKGKPIPNELIVTAKPGTDLDELAKKLGAKIVGRSKGLNSARLQFADESSTDAARKALGEDDSVLSTDPNYSVPELPEPAEGGGRGLPNLSVRESKTGDGIVIGLIDTAVQKIGGGYDAFVLPGISVAGEATLDGDRPSHGTSMAETLLKGIAAFSGETSSGVKILPVDVYGNNPATSIYELTEGIYQAMQNGADIISISSGSDGNSEYLYRVIQEGVKSGHIFVGSAGNTPVTSPVYPAAYDEVLAVAAGVSPGRLTDYSNRGPFVDVMAPGTSVIDFNGSTWQVSGTSPAAAFASGAIAGKADAAGQTLSQAVQEVRTALPPPRLQP